jgi:tight adherence protein B
MVPHKGQLWLALIGTGAALVGVSGAAVAATGTPTPTTTAQTSAATTATTAPATPTAELRPASLRSIQAAEESVTGILTVRAGQWSARVDTSSLRVQVDGKRYPAQIQPPATRQRSTMLVIDTSGSMHEEGMAILRHAVVEFLRSAPADVEVGTVSFANTAGVDLAPTRDRRAVQRSVNAQVSDGETALNDAVVAAVKGLGNTGDRSIVLLTDGHDTVSKTEEKNAIGVLKASGVHAEAIAFKTGETDNAALRRFANAGGGTVAAATNGDAVSRAFRAAAKALDSQVAWSIPTPARLTGRHTFVVTGRANGAPFRAESIVDLGKAPTSTTPPKTSSIAPGGASGSAAVPRGMQLALGLVAVFIGVMGLAIALLSPQLRSQRSQRVEAIEQYIGPGIHRLGVEKAAVRSSAIAAGLVSFGDRVMEGRESTTRTMAFLERADLPWRAGEWLVLRIVALIVGPVFGYLILAGRAQVVGALLGLLLGFFAPTLLLRFLARRRATKFESQLPDSLLLVATSLSTGFSLQQALDAVAKDAPQPTAKELSRALAETRIGADVADALERVGERMGSLNVAWAAMAIRIQRHVGGNLAETLRTTASTLREREALRRQVRTLSAEGRLSAYILIALPIVLFLYLLKVNYDYVRLLWTTPIGLFMSVGGLVFLAIGIVWMRRVVQVEV